MERSGECRNKDGTSMMIIWHRRHRHRRQNQQGASDGCYCPDYSSSFKCRHDSDSWSDMRETAQEYSEVSGMWIDDVCWRGRGRLLILIIDNHWQRLTATLPHIRPGPLLTDRWRFDCSFKLFLIPGGRWMRRADSSATWNVESPCHVAFRWGFSGR